jgi:hypothetical protein
MEHGSALGFFSEMLINPIPLVILGLMLVTALASNERFMGPIRSLFRRNA